MQISKAPARISPLLLGIWMLGALFAGSSLFAAQAQTNPTIEDLAPETTRFTEGGGPVTIVSEVTIDDEDGHAISQVRVRIVNPQDAPESLDANPGATGLVVAYDANADVLTITGDGTQTYADFEAVLKTLTYNNTLSPPTTTTRTISYVAEDENAETSAAVTNRVTIARNLSGPVMEVNPDDSPARHRSDTVFVAPGGTVAPLDDAVPPPPLNGAILRDADGNLRRLTVNLSAWADKGEKLDATAHENMIKTGGENGIPLVLEQDPAKPALKNEEWLAALKSVRYTAPASGEIGAATSRTVTFVARDYGGQSAVDTMTVVFDKDATALDLNGPGAGANAGVDYQPATWVYGTNFDFGPVALVDSDAYASDDDAFLEKITIRIGDGNPSTRGDSPDGSLEKLTAVASGTVTTIGFGTNTLTLQPVGDAATAPLSDFNAVLQTLKYDNDSTSPNNNSGNPAGRTVSIVADGGAITTSKDVTFVVDPVNDAPGVDLSGSDDTTINHQTLFVESFAGVSVASGGVVTEPEGQFIVRMRFNLDGRVDHGKTNDTDQFSKAIEKLSFSGTNVGVSFSDPVTGSHSGTITYGTGSERRVFAFNYDASTGVMDVSGNAVASYWTMVLGQLTYSNSSDDPTESDRTVSAQALDQEKGTSPVPITVINVEKRNDIAYFGSWSSQVVFNSEATGAGNVGTTTVVIGDLDDETADYAPGAIDPNVATDYNRLPASDVNADRSRYIEMTLGATRGILSLDNSEGAVPNLFFTSGSDNSENMKFIGRQQDINNVLSGLKFTSDASYVNSALITLAISDQGNTGPGGVASGNQGGYAILIDVISGDGQGGKPKISLDGESVINGDATLNSNWSTSFVFGQGQVKVADSDAFLYDIDNNINKVTISIADSANLDGAAENLNLPLAIDGVDASDYTHSYDAVNKILVINKTASGTEDDLERIIRAVTYNHTRSGGTVTGGERTITFVVNDSVVPPNQGSAHTTIDFDQGGPVVDLNGAGTGENDGKNFTKEYVPEAGAVTITDGDLVVSDPDGEIISATLKLRSLVNPGDEYLLVDTSGYSINAQYSSTGPQAGTLELTGRASDEDYRNVIASVRYSNVAPTPNSNGTAREIDITVRDHANTDTALATLTVANSEPPSASFIDLDGTDGSGDGVSSRNYLALWDQSTQTNLTDRDAFVTETDGTIQKITVTIANGTQQDGLNEILSASSVPNITVTYDATVAGGGVLTLQGPASEAAFVTAIRSVKYKNNEPTPTGDTRNFRFDVFGNSNATISATALTTISTTPPVEQESIVDLNGDGAGEDNTATWNLNGTTDLAPSATVTETDGTVRRIRVSFDALDQDDEVLAATPSGGVNVSYNTGVLTLDANATPAAYQAVLRSLTYQNNATNPTGDTRVFTVDMYGNDLATITSSATVTITSDGGGTGEATIDLDANDSTATGSGYVGTWDKTGPSAVADTDATVSETDGAIQAVTVTIVGAVDGADEVLDATVADPITKSFNTATGVLTLVGPASPAQFIPVLRSVKYQNNAAVPNGDSRSFRFDVYANNMNDVSATALATLSVGGGGDPGTDAGTSSIDLDGANGDDNDFSATFRGPDNEGNARPVRITDVDALVSNTENNIKKITATIKDMDDLDDVDSSWQDDLNEVLSATETGNVTVEYDATSAVLTLQGPATNAEFQNVLRTVRYNNQAEVPTGTRRQVEFRVFGGLQEVTAVSTINFDIDPGDPGDPGGPGGEPDFDGDGIPDAEDGDIDNDGTPNDEDDDNFTPGDLIQPIIDLNGGGTNGAGVDFKTTWIKNGSTKIADNDAKVIGGKGDTIASLTVRIVDRQDGDAETLATVATVTGVTSTYNAATGVLTLSGASTPLNYQNLVRSIIYTNEGSSEEVNEGGADDNNTTTVKVITGNTRTFEFNVYGVNGQSSSATTTIDATSTGNDNNEHFFIDEPTFTDKEATLVFRIRNTTNQPMNGIVVSGVILGTYADNEKLNAVGNLGSFSARWLTPHHFDRLLNPEKSGKAIRWRIPALGAGEEAVMTLTVPLRGDGMGKNLTNGWKADFPGAIKDEGLDPVVIR